MSQALLPSLQNLPVFYTVVISLLLMAGFSGFALLRRLRHRPPGPGFAWLKGLVLLPLWLLCLLWAGVVTYLGVFAGAMTGSWYFPLLGLAPVPLFVLLSWGLYFWVRSRRLADAAVLLLVPALGFAVFGLQRLWICEPLAWSGLGHGQQCTARLYETGAGGAIRNQATARHWYRQAAEQGVAEAAYQVAGFTPEREQKIVWYTRAADHGHAGAAYRLYWLLEKSDTAAAVTRLQAAVRQGHAGAQFRLGLLHLNAYGGVERDLGRTRQLWSRAARGGHISAMRALAIAYARGGILFDYDPDASRFWEQRAHELATSKPDIPTIEQALEGNWERELQEVRARRTRAESGDAAAQLAIGLESLQQAGTDPEPVARAFAWIERAAAAGSAQAQYRLANHFLDAAAASEPVLERGRRWLVAAADGGHEAALRRVISAFKEQTYGFPRDLQRSRGYSEALFGLLKARGVRENDPDWMTASWEYSDTLQQIETGSIVSDPLDPTDSSPAAQYQLAKQWMPSRLAEGVALLTAAAAAGYPQAQYEMARRYRTRQRSVQEEQLAIDWLTAAAASGHRGAMVDLGSVYLQGVGRIGLERNPYRAKLLFEQALRDREDVVYEQQESGGRGWKYTVESVHRWLQQVPEAVRRLDLEGLQGTQRQQALEQWYAQEQQALRALAPAGQVPAVLQQQLDELAKLRALLLQADPSAAD